MSSRFYQYFLEAHVSAKNLVWDIKGERVTQIFD